MDTKFWEFSLYFPRELLCYFEAFKTDLKSILKDEPNCVNLSALDDCYCFLIAISKEAYNRNVLKIKERIADIIMIYYKPKTIIGSINNFNVKSHDNVILVDILTSFDFVEDRNKIVSKLILNDKLYINSFVYFKLQNLIESWKDTGELINQNSLFIIDKSVKKELMQFLMDGITSKVDKVKLILESGKIRFDREIYEHPLYYSLYDYDSALFALIKNYPQKIEIENYKNFDVKFIQNLHDLFDGRLYLIE